eukprot:2676762-Lingulodinium_polyedra.AAC.1
MRPPASCAGSAATERATRCRARRKAHRLGSAIPAPAVRTPTAARCPRALRRARAWCLAPASWASS